MSTSHHAKTCACIDLAKLFFCFCIIMLHTHVHKQFPHSELILKFVFRQGVPFFFVASGFFLGKKVLSVSASQAKLGIIKEYCMRLLKPLIVFGVINGLQRAYTMFLQNKSFWEIARDLTDHILFYPYGALWFLQACIIGALLLYPFLKYNKLNLALIIGFLLYSFALVCNSYYFLADNTCFQPVVEQYMQTCISARNGLFTGFFSIGLGIKCAAIQQKRFDFFGFPHKKALLILLGGYTVYFFEILLIIHMDNSLDDEALFLSHVLILPLLVLFLVNTRCPVSNKVSLYARHLSTGMYLLHSPILWGITTFITNDNRIKFPLTAALCLIVCVFVYRTKKEPFYSLLK